MYSCVAFFQVCFVGPFFSPGSGILRKVPAPSLGGCRKGAGDRERWVRRGELLVMFKTTALVVFGVAEGASNCVQLLGANQPENNTLK